MSERTTLPPPPDDWVNMFKVTDDQLRDMYGQFPGLDRKTLEIFVRAVAEARRQRDRAETDVITKIGNRASLEAWASEHYQPNERDYVAVAFDLNFFKVLNDTFGHGTGDKALHAFSLKLLHTFRFRPRENPDEDARNRYYSPDGLFARPGGDEFIAVLPINGDFDAEKITEILDGRMRDQLVVNIEDLGDSLEPALVDKFVPVTVRYGIAVSETDTSFEELLAEADEGLKKQVGSR